MREKNLKNKPLTDRQLRNRVKKQREQGVGKLAIVKFVWDNSTRGLKDSKEFVDETW